MCYNIYSDSSNKEVTMEIKDFKEKKKYAMDFYEQAIEVNDMVHDSIRGFHYLYCYDFYHSCV